MNPISIAIAGCGPAGLAAALLLSRAGHAVTLVERFEAPKPLGSGLMLQPTGLAVLAELGLDQAILPLGSRINRLEGRSAKSGRVALDVRYDALSASSYGLAVHRASLFGVLFDAVKVARIPIRSGVEITGLASAPNNQQWLIAADGERLGPFDLVIDALGTRSPLSQAVFGRSFVRPLAYGALWASLPWPQTSDFAEDVLTQRYLKANIMVGVLPIGRRSADAPREAAFFWSLKPALYDDWLRDGLTGWKADVRAIWPQTEPFLDAIHDPGQLVLARYGHHTLPSPIGPNPAQPIAFIGDSAHSASPQLGQGANMALLDAIALARALDRSTTIASALITYARMRRRHVRVYQWMSAVFTPFFQSDGAALPALRDALVGPMSYLPIIPKLLAALVAGTIVPPLGTSEPLTAPARSRPLGVALP